MRNLLQTRMLLGAAGLACLTLTFGCPPGGNGDGNMPMDGNEANMPMDGNEANMPMGGDATNGQTLFANTCAVCHGSDASGGIGPNIQGAAAADVSARAGGEGGHPMYDISEQDAEDIAAYLATL
jgi:mono/diheme cytochrome c family protein